MVFLLKRVSHNGLFVMLSGVQKGPVSFLFGLLWEKFIKSPFKLTFSLAIIFEAFPLPNFDSHGIVFIVNKL